MKKHITAILLLAAMVAAHAVEPSKRDMEEMKSASEFAAKKQWIKAGEPKSIGKDLYQVSVTVDKKDCKATMAPDDSTMSPWRWKVISLKCPAN